MRLKEIMIRLMETKIISMEIIMKLKVQEMY